MFVKTHNFEHYSNSFICSTKVLPLFCQSIDTSVNKQKRNVGAEPIQDASLLKTIFPSGRSITFP